MDDTLKGLHSAEYFGEQRDHWWNPDFLVLIARRWQLHRAQRVLDVGCGIGHWGRTILPYLSPEAQVIGVDREPEWVRIAGETAASRGLSRRMRYSFGEVERLAFPHGAFDLVTCQTVLLHVRDDRIAIREMVRVLRPGGRLLLVEPNNLAGALLRASMGPREGLEDRLRLVRMQAICEYGKEQLGEGHNSCGDRLPGILAEIGLVDIQVYQSDRAYPMIPPYSRPAEQALRAQLLDWAAREFWIWSRADTRRYFIAGGGEAAEFDSLWRVAMDSVRTEAEELRSGRYHAAGGSVVYLISATVSS